MHWKGYEMRLAFLAALLCGLAFGQGLKLVDTDNLRLEYNGMTIISAERCELFPDNGYTKGKKFVETQGNAKVYTTYIELEGYKSRRELSFANGELEISVQTSFPAYSKKLSDNGIGYGIEIPWKTLEGASYTAIIGRGRNTSEIYGSFTEGGYDNLLENKIQILFVSAKWGDIAFDCNPKGINCFGDYGPNNVVGLWIVSREKDVLRISNPTLPQHDRFFSGDNLGKLVVYCGKPSTYDIRHSHRSYAYFSNFRPEFNYAFGNSRNGSMYNNVGVAPFSPEMKCGWMNPKGLKQVKYAESGALYSAVHGSGEGVFRVSGLRPGFHLLTLAASAGKEAVGPFDVCCGGKVQATDVKVEAGTVKTITFGAWIEEGTAELRLSGKSWCISTLGDQLLQSSQEDYTFRRGFWRGKAAPYPSVMLHNEHYACEPNYSVKIETLIRPEPGKEKEGIPKKFDLPTCHAVFDNPEEDWRYEGTVTSIGMGNQGSFTEFEKEDDCRRRIEELKASNARVLMFNGFLSRHTYPNHEARVKKALKDFGALAHQNGMMVMDHIDFSLLWNADCGFRVLAENLPSLLMTIDTHLPARGYCINNRRMQKIFLDKVEEIVRDCKLDGIMIDEMCFHGSEFCGCADCREKFHQETGWFLPLDENSPEINNRDSELWHVWMAWRQKCVGDAFYNVKLRCGRHNRKFVGMGYTTHHGLTSPFGTLLHAVAFEQIARSWDYIGTEIMPRNIFAVYRSVAAFRRLKNYFRHSFGLPVYGEVYTAGDYWNNSYFGWALNSLNGQSTWGMAPHPVLKPGNSDYTQFTREKGNMDRRKAETLSRIAVYFSPQSRDWPQFSPYVTSILGYSMMMNDAHLEHDFITNVNFDEKTLSKYGVLLMNNAVCLADDEVEMALKFAEEGGVLFLSLRAGMKNGNGVFRDKWAFSDVFGGMTPLFTRNMQYGKMELEGVDYEFEKPVLGIRVQKVPKDLRKVGKAFFNGSDKAEAAAYMAKHGKGYVLYTPLDFGCAIWVPEQMVGHVFEGARYPVCQKAAQELHGNLAKAMGLPDEFYTAWNPGNTPECVLTGLFQENDSCIIHFLNASGSRLKIGEKIPPCLPEPFFPDLQEDIRFEVFTGGRQPVAVYAVSPDYEGRIPLATSPVGGTKLAVTLPRQYIKAYTLVHIDYNRHSLHNDMRIP